MPSEGESAKRLNFGDLVQLSDLEKRSPERTLRTTSGGCLVYD